MTKNRYRLDTGCIIDQRTGEILSDKKIVGRLNRQDRMIKIKENHVQAMINALNDEIENAETEELRNALIRISNKKLDL